MPRMDAELSRKLRDRRSVVDLEGTQWVSCDEWLQELHSSGAPAKLHSSGSDTKLQSSGSAAKAKPSFQALSSSGRLFGLAADPLAAPSTEQGNRHGSAGSIDSELVQKLQLRRGVVDSEGSAWQRLPEALPEARLRGHSALGAIGKDGNADAATTDASNEILERHGIRTVEKLAAQMENPKHSQERETHNSTDSSKDSELVRKLQTRRGVVDSEGSAWQSLPPKAAGPLRSRAERRAERRHTIDGAGLVSRLGTEKVQGPIDSELAQILTARRGVVDSEGSAWQKLPGASIAIEHTEHGNELDETEGNADDDNSAVSMAKCPRQECMAGSGVPAVAAARARTLGELRPWEEIHRGAETWACEVWLSREADHYGGVGTLAAEPAVICVARDGEIFCFVPEPVPLECEEDSGDVGRLVASFTPDSLMSLRRSATAPDMLGFRIAEALGAALGLEESFGQQGKAEEVENLEPVQALYVRFEGPEEATACVEAIAAATAADLPIVQRALPEELEAAMRGPAVPEEEEQGLIGAKNEGIVNWVTLGEEPPGGWSSSAAGMTMWIEGDDTL